MSVIKKIKTELISITYTQNDSIVIQYFIDKYNKGSLEEFVPIETELKAGTKEFYFLEKLLIYNNEWVPYQNLVTSIRAEDAIDIKKSLNKKTNNVLKGYFVSSKKHLEEKSDKFINEKLDKKKRAFHNNFMLKAYQLKFPKIKFQVDYKPELREWKVNIPNCPPEKYYKQIRYKRLAHCEITNIRMYEYFEENWSGY